MKVLQCFNYRKLHSYRIIIERYGAANGRIVCIDKILEHGNTRKVNLKAFSGETLRDIHLEAAKEWELFWHQFETFRDFQRAPRSYIEKQDLRDIQTVMNS